MFVRRAILQNNVLSPLGEIYRSTQFELPDHMILIKKNSDPNFFLINVRSHTKEGFGKFMNASLCADPILAENILPEFIYSEEFFKFNNFLHRADRQTMVVHDYLQ